MDITFDYKINNGLNVLVNVAIKLAACNEIYLAAYMAMVVQQSMI